MKLKDVDISMKRIISLTCLKFFLFCLLLVVSTWSSADSLTVACPEASKLTKTGNNTWSATIPASDTQNGHPVSAIVLTGQLADKYKDNDNITFHMIAGMGFGIAEETRAFFSCDYDTQFSGNYQMGNGVEIHLSGKTDLFKYFDFSDCHINSLNHAVDCSNRL